MPGLIDLHVHGAQGHDVMDASPEAVNGIAQALAAEGVTGFLATTMAAPTAHIEAVLAQTYSPKSPAVGARVLGYHLEGPFIATSKLGAQNPAGISTPSIELCRRWQKLAQLPIQLMTLAPELPGALALITYLQTCQIIVACGHTDATFAQVQAAIQAGCQYATHLGNAMRGILQREPGALGALLLDDRVMAELIVDGFHLHPAFVELAWRLKGQDHLLLVSDAMRAKCLSDGRYDLGGQVVNVSNARATLADGTLAGSTLQLPQAIARMQKYTHCSLPQAVNLASRNPARVLKLEHLYGSLKAGLQADLAIMDASFETQLTMCGGNIVYNKT
jgi:N-acetylglucosamine-6-phosphate deacetylase